MAEAQKVIQRGTVDGDVEVSIVESIVKLLEPLPFEQKLKVLREVEARIGVTPLGSIRKVTRRGRSFAVSVTKELEGSYDLIIDSKNKVLIYIRNPEGKIRARDYNGVKLPIPKGAWEAIGRPEYVVVEVAGDRIVVRPLR